MQYRETTTHEIDSPDGDESVTVEIEWEVTDERDSWESSGLISQEAIWFRIIDAGTYDWIDLEYLNEYTF